MKTQILFLLLLAAIVGNGQSIALPTLAKDTIPMYDTIKVIAEIYELPHKVFDNGDSCWYYSDGIITVKIPIHNGFGGSVSHLDTTQVSSRKVLAWEVWRKDWRTVWVKSEYGIGGYYDEQQLVPVEMVKRLTYNRKDEITNVLQSWRVEW